MRIGLGDGMVAIMKLLLSRIMAMKLKTRRDGSLAYEFSISLGRDPITGKQNFYYETWNRNIYIWEKLYFMLSYISIVYYLFDFNQVIC